MNIEKAIKVSRRENRIVELRPDSTEQHEAHTDALLAACVGRVYEGSYTTYWGPDWQINLIAAG